MKNSGSGWVGLAPTRIFIVLGKFCVFPVFFSCFKMFQKKNWLGGGLVGSDQFEFFSDFFDFFNLTIPLSKHLGCSMVSVHITGVAAAVKYIF